MSSWVNVVSPCR